jgi:oligoendopeptidase F
VLSGFLVGKFEYTVLSQRDDMTPQDVVDCWDDIIGDYTDLPFYEITHIFEMPGYYVSYAVSALAAFDIWKDCLSDPDEGLEKYEKLARIPSNSNSTKFLETLEKCGFSSVMTSEYIDSLAQELSEYAREQIN